MDKPELSLTDAIQQALDGVNNRVLGRQGVTFYVPLEKRAFRDVRRYNEPLVRMWDYPRIIDKREEMRFLSVRIEREIIIGVPDDLALKRARAVRVFFSLHSVETGSSIQSEFPVHIGPLEAADLVSAETIRDKLCEMIARCGDLVLDAGPLPSDSLGITQ